MKPNQAIIKTADSNKLSLYNGQDSTLGAGAAGSQISNTLLTPAALQSLSGKAIRFFYGGETEDELKVTAARIMSSYPMPGVFRTGEGYNYVANIEVNALTGMTTENGNYSQVNKSGSRQFIRVTSKYMVRLIKDTTGTIIGVCAVQQS